MWISTARPARGSESTACRHDDLVTRLREAGFAAIADLGFVGLDDEDGDPAVINGYEHGITRPRHPPDPHVQDEHNSLPECARLVT
ncbi:hypothetical protein [Streptomyces phytophilus]|uniref:hypothetical protein n=1 Tax=Streptomyces phytophilus TaxID=722715 RepID=UPI0015F00330|nr:hypothetical protein [Streptomyces phytophilus]